MRSGYFSQSSRPVNDELSRSTIVDSLCPVKFQVEVPQDANEKKADVFAETAASHGVRARVRTVAAETKVVSQADRVDSSC